MDLLRNHGDVVQVVLQILLALAVHIVVGFLAAQRLHATIQPPEPHPTQARTYTPQSALRQQGKTPLEHTARATAALAGDCARAAYATPCTLSTAPTGERGRRHAHAGTTREPA